MLKVIDGIVVGEGEIGRATLDEIARRGAEEMLKRALIEEVAWYIERYENERDAERRRLVVRNGRARERPITCGTGTLKVRAPRINDKRV